MTAVEVRAATVNDRASVIRLLGAQMNEHEIPVEEAGTERAVELALSAGGSAWLTVATISGMVVGVMLANPIVSVEFGGAALWIEELYVAPAHRRRGVARALLDFITVEARNAGLSALDLEVDPDMHAAQALYASLGFSPVDRKRLVREI
jgi:ribosomal protein S18 acetylase RimI-like enzyme